MKHKQNLIVRQATPEELTRGQFTKISFKPDWNRFDTGELDHGTLSLMRTRVVETAALHPKLKVSWNDTALDLDFASYSSLHLAEDEPLVHTQVNKNWEIAVAANIEGTEEMIHSSFVNSVSTARAGTHVDVVADWVATAVRDACIGKLGSKVRMKPVEAVTADLKRDESP